VKAKALVCRAQIIDGEEWDGSTHKEGPPTHGQIEAVYEDRVESDASQEQEFES